MTLCWRGLCATHTHRPLATYFLAARIRTYIEGGGEKNKKREKTSRFFAKENLPVFWGALLNLVERLLKIVEDVIDMLSTDRQSDGALMDSDVLQLFLGKL